MILHYFKKKENIEKGIARETYKKILFESNNLLKHNAFFINKDYQTSFEIVSVFLIIHIKAHINKKKNNYKIINEELIKLFVSDLDESLREKGIGDMSIGKYVKSYVKKFYFRLSKFPKDIETISLSSFDEYISNFDFITDDDKSKASKVFFKIFKNILATI